MSDEASQPTMPVRTRLKTADVILGRYEIAGILGHGGMGEVFRCSDRVAKIDVAIKAIPPELSRDAAEMEDVRENFRLVEKLHHPNIAALKTLELDRASGDYYLVMEWVHGVNLHQHRKQRGGKLPMDEILPMVRQVAEALDYAHRMKIIHRDIKPSNIMVDSDGAVKVLDFGIAAQLHSSMSHISRTERPTGGTAPYMSPEQWRGAHQDGSTDQYSLGVMVYLLATGRLPFDSHDVGVLCEMILREPPERPEDMDPFKWIAIERCLAKKPGDRFKTCGAFVEGLSLEEPTRATRAQRVELPAAGRAGRRWPAAVAALLIAAALAAGGYLFNQQRLRSQAAERALAAEARQQAGELIGRGDSLRETGNLTEALARYAEARKLTPQNAAIDARIELTTREILRKEGDKRKQLEEQKRAEAVRRADELVQEGDVARQKGNPDEALAKYIQAQELRSGDKNLETVIEERKKAILAQKAATGQKEEERKQLEETKDKVNALVSQADALRIKGDLQGALSKYLEARNLVPSDIVVQGLVVQTRNEIADAETARKRDAEQRLAAEVRRKADDWIRLGNTAREKGDWTDALAKYAEARKLAPTDPKIGTLITETEKERAAREEAARQKAETEKRVADLRKEIAALMTSVQASMQKGDFEGALTRARQASALISADKNLEGLLADAKADVLKKEAEAAKRLGEQQKVAEARKKAGQLVQLGDLARQQGDMEAALARYIAAQNLVPNDERIARVVAEIKNELTAKDEKPEADSAEKPRRPRIH